MKQTGFYVPFRDIIIPFPLPFVNTEVSFQKNFFPAARGKSRGRQGLFVRSGRNGAGTSRSAYKNPVPNRLVRGGAVALPFLHSVIRRLLFLRIDGDLLFVPAEALELHDAVDEGEERIVLAKPDVVARVELGAALADENVAREHFLPVAALYAEALCLAVAPVVGRTGTFFMRKYFQKNHDLFLPAFTA